MIIQSLRLRGASRRRAGLSRHHLPSASSRHAPLWPIRSASRRLAGVRPRPRRRGPRSPVRLSEWSALPRRSGCGCSMGSRPFVADGGPPRLGLVRVRRGVDPEGVVLQGPLLSGSGRPGSLGLESRRQLLKVAPTALARRARVRVRFAGRGAGHHWTYHGQVLPGTSRHVTVRPRHGRSDDRRDGAGPTASSVDGRRHLPDERLLAYRNPGSTGNHAWRLAPGMKYSEVYVDAIGYELPPVVVTSTELESRLAAVYEALHGSRGRLEPYRHHRSGRWWDRAMRGVARGRSGRAALRWRPRRSGPKTSMS